MRKNPAAPRVRLNLALSPRFHFLEVCLRIKSLHDPTFQTFFNGGAECCHFLFLVFQEKKYGCGFHTL